MKHIIPDRSALRAVLAGMSVASLFAAAHVCAAEEMNRDTTTEGLSNQDATWDMRFEDVDKNNNNGVEWEELQAAYGNQLKQVGWRESEVFSRFDPSDDKMLDKTEYLFFITGLEQNVIEERSR